VLVSTKELFVIFQRLSKAVTAIAESGMRQFRRLGYGLAQNRNHKKKSLEKRKSWT
jgi:hypothetical protein